MPAELYARASPGTQADLEDFMLNPSSTLVGVKIAMFVPLANRIGRLCDHCRAQSPVSGSQSVDL